jgi:hypothetical protein
MPTSWPTQIDYQDAVTFPALCFSDPALQTATVADRTAFDLPLPVTGQFTSVYRLVTPDGAAWAVRLFLRPMPDRAARWKALAAHVAALPAPPPSFVPFTFQEEGIRVAGRWYPLVKMPYIAASDLHAYIEKNLYDGPALTRLAASLRQAFLDWEGARLTHGDLQHGNILVEASGAVRLIDYDGAFVPTLTGMVSRETGHPAYQHPARTAAVFGPVLDRFPALVLYTAVRVLAVAPELWYRLDNGDNLLFRREDFAKPAKSRAFLAIQETLRAFPAERQLATALRQACDAPLSAVPPLDRLR